jgi:uncharacterized protein YjdB
LVSTYSEAQTTITKAIASGADDVEEGGPGSAFGTGHGYMYMNSGRIELVTDNEEPTSGAQTIGLRFTGMTIPKNAVITNAFLTFTGVTPVSPNTNNAATSLTIRGQSADNAPAFTTTAFNVSSRSVTGTSAAWSPGTWASGVNYNSPSIAGIVQEIVNRSGWNSGNAMVMIITGTGSRASYAYELNASLAARLTVSYTTSAPISLSTSVTDVVCRGDASGSITLNVSGGVPGYTYDWSNNGPNDPDIDPKDLTNVGAGSYVVTVTDASGTTATATATITQPPTRVNLTGIVTKVSSPGGSNGAIDITPTGGSPAYTYMWGNGTTTQDIHNLTAGSYQVTVTDNSGCTASSAFEVSTNTNASIVNKQLYLSDGLTLDRSNPAATPIDNTSSLTETLSNATPGVTVQNITSTSSTSGSTITLSHTINDSDNRLLLVGISARERNVNAITYGGVAMTLVGFANRGTDSRVYIYRMLAPPVGTANIVVTFSGSLSKGAVVGAISYSGVNQSTPLGTFATANADATNPSVNASSTSGDLVFDVVALKNLNAMTAGSGQTQRWNITSGEIRATCSTEPATGTSTTMSWTSSKGKWVIGAVSIKPAAVVSNITFTQSPVLCSPLTIKANEPISLETHLNIVSGSMPVNPNITAVIRYGANNIITLSNPTWNSATGILTWTGTRGTDITVPASQAIALQLTTAQPGVTFRVRHDSNIYPSKITLPVSTFINITNHNVYNASHPNGTIVSNIPNVGSSFIRISVTDPFGAYDITGVQLALTKPDNSSINIHLNDNYVVGTITCGKVYEYLWLNPGDLGTWNLAAIAEEGSEGVTHSANVNKEVIVPTGPVVVTKQLYLSDPSQSLDRIDPVNTNDGTTAQTATLTPPATSNLTLTASADVEIWNGTNGTTHNYGSCDKIYLNGSPIQRDFLRFNLSSVPANSTINSATLNMVKTGGSTTSTEVSVHRVTNDWTEGTGSCSGSAGVANFNQRMPSTNWTSAGGDFNPSAEATTNVSSNGSYSWTVTSLVQGWYNNSFSNFGLMLKFATEGVSREMDFGSRENGTAGNRPTLTVNYTSSGGSTTFTQNPALCSPLTIAANNPIVINTYVSVISGTMPSNPAITAQLRHNGTPFATISNPVFSNGQLTWTTSLGSNLTIPAGQNISLVITNNQTGVSFRIDYDSNTKASRIDFPVTTFIDVNSFNAFSAPFPSGTVITTATKASPVYFRATVSDPFGPSDITGMTVNISPLGITQNATSVATSGCTRTYQYTWNSPNTSGDFNITATAREGYENTVVDFAYLNFSLCPLEISPAIIASPNCLVPDGGDVILNVTGGKGPFTYSWTRTNPSGSGSGSGNQLMGMFPGNYTITVTSNGGCTGTANFTLEQTAPPVLELLPTNTGTLCYDGSIDIMLQGGSGNFEYFWSDGFYTPTRQNLIPGMYYLTVTDIESGCTATAETEILLGSPINATVFFLHPSCNGDSNGALNLTSFGGTGVYTFNWSDGPTTEDRTNLSAGNYIVTITDSGGCSAVYIYSLNEPAPLNIALTPTEITCNQSGIITLDITGGVEPFSFDWEDIPGSFNVRNRSGLSAGTYRVTVTDINQCTASHQIILTAPDCDPDAYAICRSELSQYFSVEPDPEVENYIWTVPEGADIMSGQGSSAITVDWTNVVSGTGWICVTTYNDCGESEPECIPVYVKEVAAAAALAPPVCNGAPLQFLGSGGVAYRWSGPNNFESTLENPVIEVANLNHNGTYSVTVTNDNGCTATTTVVVSVNPNPSITLQEINAEDCQAEDGSVISTPSGGTAPYQYIWSNGLTSQNLSDIGIGSYRVTITDSNGCTGTNEASLSYNEGLNVEIFKTNVSCFNGNNGAATVNVSGGSGNFSYLWSNGQMTQNLDNLRAGTYIVTITDIDDGCLGISSVNILQPSLIQLDRLLSHVNCFGGNNGSINLIPGGGMQPYSFNWADIEGNNNPEDRTNLTAGSYTVTVTDTNGCSMSMTAQIQQPATGLNLNVQKRDVRCYGSSDAIIDITPSGGTLPYSYLWNGGAITQDRIHLDPGVYTVTVTDAKYCTSTASVTINEPDELWLSHSKTDVSCFKGNNGSLDLNVIGGTAPFNYLWTSGDTIQDISGLSAGQYSVLVTDNNGCTSTRNVIINQPDEIGFNLTPYQVGCFGGNNGSIQLSVIGGTPSYTYLWSDGKTTQNVSGLSAGAYTVTISDNNLCTKTGTVSVGQPAQLNITGVTKNINCNANQTGNIELSVTGGAGNYTFNWSNGSTSEDPENLPSGIYTVTVTDANACTSTSSYSISQPSPLSINAIPSNTGCFGQNQGVVTTSVNGGTAPYTYAWSNGFSTSNISNLRPGVYTVTVTDNQGCTNTAQTIVTQPDRLQNTATVVPACPNQANGIATMTTTGGTVPYQYNWSDIGSGASTRSGINAGDYIVTVTDQNGCSTITTFSNTPLTLSLFNIDPTCGKDGNGGVMIRQDGEIYLKTEGGTIPYSIIWSNGQTSDHVTQLLPGTYYVTVVGGACQATAQTTLTSGVCVPPVANDDFYVTEMNIPVSGNIATNDYDPNTEYPLTFLPLGIVDADKGKLDWHPDFDGSFTFYPTQGYFGTFSLPYQVCDTLELCATGLLTIRVEKPVAGIAKRISAGPDHNGDGSYDVTYSIYVENYSLFTLKELQITESLDTVFEGSVSWQVNSVTSNNFEVNFPGFNGISQKNLLTGTDTLAPFASGTIQMNITITPGQNRGPYYNHAHLKTTSPNNIEYADLSQNGSDPDPDNDGDPLNNNESTPLLFCPGASVTGNTTICVGQTTTMSPSTGGVWTSLNPAVATINNSGVVTAISPGTARFTYSQDLCISEPSAIVTVNGVVPSVTGSTSICLGTITNLLPTTGGTWTSSNPSVATVNNSGVVTGVTSGTATFTFYHTTSGCISPPTEVVNVSDKPVVNITGPASICTGNTTSLSPSAGGTWTSSNPSVATVSNSGVVTGIAQGIATFTFTHSSGCVSLPTAPVTVNAKPITSLIGDNAVCIGSTTQFLPSVGGIWTSSNPAIASITNSGLVTGIATGTATFTFSESSSGCISDASQPITIKNRPTANLTGPGEICVGFTTQVSPSTGGIWTSSSSAIATVSNSGVVFGVAPGTASFTFRDLATECLSVPTTPVTVYPRPTIQYTGPSTICVGSTTTLSPSAGGTWTSSNPSIAQITNGGVVNAVAPGTVTFTFTNTTTGCISLASAPLTVLARPVVNMTGATSICVGTTTTLTPTSGGTWTSSNSSVATVNNSGIVTGLAPGVVSFFFTETSTGCTSNSTAQITILAQPVISLSGPGTICQGAVTNVLPSSGGTWISSNPAIASVTNAGLVTGLANGTAFLSFTSAAGCTASNPISVSVNGRPSTTLSGPSSICIGGTTTFLPATGGTWISNNPAVATITNTGTVTAISAGTATFRFTDNSTGCVSDHSTSITINNNPTVNITGSATICAGSTTTLTPTVGGSWTSLNPSVATVNNAGIVSGVAGGTATFVFTQTSTGCSSSASNPITVNPRPVIEITGPNPVCVGNTTQMSPSAGGIWASTNPAIASITNAGVITAHQQGTVRFTFTATSTGCVSNQSSLLTVNPRPTANVSGSGQICVGSTTTLFPATGGTWASLNPAVATVTNGGIVTGISYGTTSFIFTDNNTGCSSLASQPVTVSTNQGVQFTGPTSICAGFTTMLSPTSGGVWVSNNPAIATVSATGLVTGISSGLVTFTFTQTGEECNGVVTTDSLRVYHCFEPDFNITTVNVSVNGDVRTNDMVPLTTSYGTVPSLVSRPPGSVYTLQVNASGTYSFVADLPGEYVFNVPVCVPGAGNQCPNSQLRITVMDLFRMGKSPIANLDRADTYSNPDPALPGTPVTLLTLANDQCIYGSGCSLDPASVAVISPPSHGTFQIHINGNITYTPGPGFSGADILTYRVCVSGELTNCATAQQIINVLNYNVGTQNTTNANDDFFTTYQETVIAGNVKINDVDAEGDNQYVIQAGNLQNPVRITGGSYYLNDNGDFTFTPDPGFYGPTSFTYSTCDDNPDQRCAKATVHIIVLRDLPVQIRMYLEGPLHNNGNAKAPDNRPLMRDNLRVSTFSGQNCIPMMSPYKYATDFVDVRSKYLNWGAGTLERLDSIKNPMSVFSVSGQNAIVDWVFVELRSKYDNKEIVASRSGLLQRDGDVVDNDGVSPISFPGVGVDSFYVVVKHRNHLGAMTQLVPITGLIDFTVPSTPLFDFGQHPNGYDYTGLAMNTQIKHGYRALWAGDFDGDGKLKFVNPNDDQNILFFEVFAYPDNLINSANYNFALGYQQGDYDLNGKSKYDNPDDDKNLLFSQILLYPLNINLLSNFNYLIQQVPTPNPK